MFQSVTSDQPHASASPSPTSMTWTGAPSCSRASLTSLVPTASASTRSDSGSWNTRERL